MTPARALHYSTNYVAMSGEACDSVLKMQPFTPSDIEDLDNLWRDLSEDHPWSGWAFIEAQTGEIWVFRKRANWRRFVLRRVGEGFSLEDERGEEVRLFSRMAELPGAVADMPTLADGQTG